MLIEGTHTLQAPPAEVWQALTLQESLRKTIPGAEQVTLQQTGDTDSYEVALNIPQGPFRGHHTELLTFSQQHAPFQYQLTIEDQQQEAFKATYTVHLQAHNQATIVTYQGTLTDNTPASLLPQKIMKGAIKYLLQEYFLALTALLYTPSGTQTAAKNTKEKIGAAILRQARGNIAILPQSLADKKAACNVTEWGRTLLARSSRLIWKDAQQQALWLKRARQIGIVAGLIALVWVGTKIPRRS